MLGVRMRMRMGLTDRVYPQPQEELIAYFNNETSNAVGSDSRLCHLMHRALVCCFHPSRARLHAVGPFLMQLLNSLQRRQKG